MRLVSPPSLLGSTACGPRGNPVRFPFSQEIPRPFPPNSHAMRSPRSRGDETGQSDNLRLEGEASRFRWLRAAATTEIVLHTPMTGITAKVLSDEGPRTEAAGLRQPAQNCTQDWKSCSSGAGPATGLDLVLRAGWRYGYLSTPRNRLASRPA